MKYAALPAQLRPTPHPVYAVLEEGEELDRVLKSPNGANAYSDWLNKRERLIRMEKEDPLHYGCVLEPIWSEAERLLEKGNDVLILGGNRSSKTEFGARMLVKMLRPHAAVLERPATVWAFQSDERASIDRQQTYVRRYLPPDLRDAGKHGRVTNVCYTVKNGFSEGIFVLPNHSMCRFMSYAMDQRSLEGAELDLCWCDELVPSDMLETLRYRLVTRGGKMLVTFTPLEGYSVAVKQYLEGARVLSSLPAPMLPQDQVLVPGCPKGHMPYVLECASPGRYVICFHSVFNPFNPVENLNNLVANAPLSEKMVRAYGWPTKQIAGAFPRFGDVHIVPPDAIPHQGTNYLMVDPGGAKNWFMVWVRVDNLGRAYVYREWPFADVEGEWALASDKADGKPGPAQRAGAGRGILGYKELILLEEGWIAEMVPGDSTYGDSVYVEGPRAERIFERIIDPRAGTAAVPGIEDGTSLVELMADEQVNKDGRVIGPSMVFVPSPSCKVDEGTGLINDLLAYNPELPVTIENCPRLYVSADCRNLIYALRTWTGADGEKGATKDPVDALKYGVKRGLEYMGSEMFAHVPGRGF